MSALVKSEGLHFSVSQMKAWLMCPRKFEFRYVLGAEQEFLPMPLVFGTAFHSALATHYQGFMRGAEVPRRGGGPEKSSIPAAREEGF